FFFSSRRRHTRFSRDWSSDVCSSDLRILPQSVICVKSWAVNSIEAGAVRSAGPTSVRQVPSRFLTCKRYVPSESCSKRAEFNHRSEERRVGKERRSRWSPDQYRKEQR